MANGKWQKPQLAIRYPLSGEGRAGRSRHPFPPPDHPLTTHEKKGSQPYPSILPQVKMVCYHRLIRGRLEVTKEVVNFSLTVKLPPTSRSNRLEEILVHSGLLKFDTLTVNGETPGRTPDDPLGS